MFRLTRYLEILERRVPGPVTGPRPAAVPAAARASGPVVIWNLVRRCNLTCRHCYATAANRDFPGELSTVEVYAVMDELRAFGVPVLILSGGEPLMRADILDVSRRAKSKGFYVGLSTNGTLIDRDNIGAIAAVGYDYVGISLDGMRDTHDRFRRRSGAFDEALRAIRLCRDAGIRIGLRFTLTRDNIADLGALLGLMETERIDKFYLSHLNYAGRGNRNRRDDLHHAMTRRAMDLLIDTAVRHLRQDRGTEFVTGNNDADGPYLLQWACRRRPDRAAALAAALRRWGGNASGVRIANIDNLGNVHPDTMWWDYTIGNVRERPFAAIWNDTGDPLMAGLKRRRRPLEGRCGACRFLDICGGNSRTRAWQLTGNPWAEDPGCYLDDGEIGVAGLDLPARLEVTAYRSPRRRRVPAPS